MNCTYSRLIGSKLTHISLIASGAGWKRIKTDETKIRPQWVKETERETPSCISTTSDVVEDSRISTFPRRRKNPRNDRLFCFIFPRFVHASMDSSFSCSLITGLKRKSPVAREPEWEWTMERMGFETHCNAHCGAPIEILFLYEWTFSIVVHSPLHAQPTAYYRPHPYCTPFTSPCGVRPTRGKG